MSWPPTLADEPEALREARLHPDSPDLPTATVEAPCCGRRCAADMVTDLRDIPGTVIRPGGQGPPEDVEWACDGCYRRLTRESTNGWTESSLARALGAPQKTVARKRAREVLRETLRTNGGPMKARDFLHGRVEEFVQLDQVPGTGPPDVS